MGDRHGEKDFTCPYCGKETVVPVVSAIGGFLAVHQIRYGTRAASRNIPREIATRFCRESGMTVIEDFQPSEKLKCDFPKDDKSFESHRAAMRELGIIR